MKPEEDVAIRTVRRAYNEGSLEYVPDDMLEIALAVIRRWEQFFEEVFGSPELIRKVEDAVVDVLRHRCLPEPVWDGDDDD